MTDAPEVTFTARHKELLQELLEQYGRASPAKRELIKRAAAMATYCEALEASMALGRKVDMSNYTRAVTTLRQLLTEDDGLDDFRPVVEVTEHTTLRNKARQIAFAVGIARKEGRLHHLDPALLDFVSLVPPEDIEVDETTPVASNDNPQEFSCQD